jgi:hypothetical protein
VDHSLTDVRTVPVLGLEKLRGAGQETADVPDAPHAIELFLGEITQRHTRLQLAVLTVDPYRSVGLHRVAATVTAPGGGRSG